MDAGFKTPQCPHLSSHCCISNTTINSRTDLSPIPVRSAVKSYKTSWCIQNLSKRALNRQTVDSKSVAAEIRRGKKDRKKKIDRKKLQGKNIMPPLHRAAKAISNGAPILVSNKIYAIKLRTLTQYLLEIHVSYMCWYPALSVESCLWLSGTWPLLAEGPQYTVAYQRIWMW